MSSLYNHIYHNAPHILDRQRIEQERANNEEWERFECEEVVHELVSSGTVIDHEVLTRKQAARRNRALADVNRNAEWREWKGEEETISNNNSMPF